jgi:hypothetical protein
MARKWHNIPPQYFTLSTNFFNNLKQYIMKKFALKIFIPALILAFGISIACTKSDIQSDRTSVSITDSDAVYELTASYSAYKIPKVQSFVNETMKPTVVFKSVDDSFTKTIALDDKTTLVMTTSSGKLRMKLDKRENANASYAKVKELFEGVKGALN